MIYIIDDNIIFAEALKEFLEIEYKDKNIEFFGKSEIALKKVLKKRPEIIITDNEMPKLKGIELLRIAQQAYKPKTIMISAARNYYFEKELVDCFLRKPVQFKEVAETINLMLSSTDVNVKNNLKLENKLKINIADQILLRNSVRNYDYIENAKTEKSIYEFLANEIKKTPSAVKQQFRKIFKNNKKILGKMETKTLIEKFKDEIIEKEGK